MRCNHVDEILNGHIYADLAPRARAELDEHLGGCARCSAAWRVHEALVGFPAAQPDPRLFEGIVGQLDAAPRLPRPLPMRRWVPHFGLAALLAIVGLTVWVLESPLPTPPQTEARDVGEVRDATSVEIDPGRFAEGRDYRTLPLAARVVAADDGVEVVEMFMYACFPCFAFEPHLQAWSETRGEDIRLERVPVTWGPLAALHARAFYTAELLGKSEQVHAAFFQEVHVGGNRLDSEAMLAAFFERFGVDQATFRRTFRSADVDARLARADALARRFGTTGTPSLIVDGTYVTGGAMAPDYETLVAIVDELVTESATCRGREELPSCRF